MRRDELRKALNRIAQTCPRSLWAKRTEQVLIQWLLDGAQNK